MGSLLANKSKSLAKLKLMIPNFFTLGMKVEVEVILEFLEHPMEVVHYHHKENWGERVSLSEPSLSHQEFRQFSIHLISIGHCVDVQHYPSNKLVGEYSPAHTNIHNHRLLQIHLDHAPRRTIASTVTFNQFKSQQNIILYLISWDKGSFALVHKVTYDCS